VQPIRAPKRAESSEASLSSIGDLPEFLAAADSFNVRKVLPASSQVAHVQSIPRAPHPAAMQDQVGPEGLVAVPDSPASGLASAPVPVGLVVHVQALALAERLHLQARPRARSVRALPRAVAVASSTRRPKKAR
jgi:hypothetical protein